MAPSTPTKVRKRTEYDTVKRMRFFDAWSRKRPGTGVASVAHRPEINIPTSTARYWLKHRDILGIAALRSTIRRGSTYGPKPTVSADVLTTITDQENPLHEKGYADQVAELNLKCAPRTLQRYRTRAGAQRFRKLVTTEISEKNKGLRVNYGLEQRTRLWQASGSIYGSQTKYITSLPHCRTNLNTSFDSWVSRNDWSLFVKKNNWFTSYRPHVNVTHLLWFDIFICLHQAASHKACSRQPAV